MGQLSAITREPTHFAEKPAKSVKFDDKVVAAAYEPPGAAYIDEDVYISQEEYMSLMKEHRMDPLYYDFAGTAIYPRGEPPPWQTPKHPAKHGVKEESQGLKVSNRIESLLKSVAEDPGENSGF